MTVTVTHEPLTYERDRPGVSYFKDLLAVRNNDAAAMVRLSRHAQEMDRIGRDRALQAELGLARAGVETRVAPGRTQGQGGYFSPPAWLVSQFATAPRTGRVLSALMPFFDLPPNAQSVWVPFINPGTAGAIQIDGAPMPDTDFSDGIDTSAVVTIAGKTDVPVQLLEQSPAGAHLDWVLFQDLDEAYNQQLEQQLIYGAGNVTGAGPGNDQLIGVTARSTVNTITWTTGAPTDVLFYNQLGLVAAKVANNRKRPPECWLMRSGRWAWMGASPDAQSRPFVLPASATARQNDPTGQRVGDMLGWPVYVNDAIPNTLTAPSIQPGSAVNQDEVIALRLSDLMLLEGDANTNVFTEVLSGTLQARISSSRYVAALTGRRTSGICVLVGTGMTLPAAYNA